MLHPVTNVALLANLSAGKGRALHVAREVSGLLNRSGIKFTVFFRDWPETLGSYGFSDIFLVGGDGTLNYFINKYPTPAIPLTLFKGGSGNDFAWKLYGDLPVSNLYHKILKTDPYALDLGICNGKRFLNGAGIGFDGAVVRSMGSKRFVSAGYLAYLWAVIKNIAVFREHECTIKTENKSFSGKYFMISIANGERYGGGFIVAPGADIRDGLLELVMIRKIAPVKRLQHLPKLSNGTHVDLEFVQRCQAKEIWITSERILEGHRDGELVEAKEFHLQVIPSGIRMRF